MHQRLPIQGRERLSRLIARHASSKLSVAPARSTRYSLPRFFLFNAALLLGLGTTTLLLSRSSSPSSRESILSEEKFTPFILRSKEIVSPTSSIFTLVPKTPLPGINPYRELWKQCLWSVQAKQPQLQIVRSYTPLPPSSDTSSETPDDGTLRFLIRQEPNGEVSGYLHKLSVGSTISLRGPKIEFECPDDIDEVLFLAGGTGIAPALQLARALMAAKPAGSHIPRIQLLWANRRREDCAGGQSISAHIQGSWFRWFKANPSKSDIPMPASPIVEELNRLRQRHDGTLLVDYFVDEENTFINQATLNRYLDSTVRGTRSKDPPRKLILVSGPDGFVARLAGPKEWSGGREVQGRLDGLLKNSRRQGWEVWKL